MQIFVDVVIFFFVVGESKEKVLLVFFSLSFFSKFVVTKNLHLWGRSLEQGNLREFLLRLLQEAYRPCCCFSSVAIKACYKP
jgi:hypothetical protein